jgi:3-phytase
MPAEKIFRVAVLLLLFAALAAPPSAAQSRAARGAAAPAGAALPTVKPRIVSETVKHDSDDPAIWIDRSNPARSLVLGTDKDADGALYVFGLDGKIRHDLVVRGLARPNNVDVAYDVMVGGQKIDVAIVAERFANRLRVYSLPDMRPVDGGGIPVFEGERARDVMGVATYTRPADGALFAIVSRSDRFAPKQGYLHQYRLVDDGTGTLRGLKTRAFGEWSGKKEIEALSVDGADGFVFASDETFGIRKYHADPSVEDADDELAQFGLTGFARDHEGSAVFRRGNERPLLFVSDQQAGELRIFELEGPAGTPHRHALVGRVKYMAQETDGIDLTGESLPGFPGGLLVAMSTDRTYHFYALDEILGAMSSISPISASSP